MGIFHTLMLIDSAVRVAPTVVKVSQEAYDSRQEIKDKAAQGCESSKKILSEKKESLHFQFKNKKKEALESINKQRKDFSQKIKGEPEKTPVVHSKIYYEETHANPFAKSNTERLGIEVPETEKPKKRLFC